MWLMWSSLSLITAFTTTCQQCCWQIRSHTCTPVHFNLESDLWGCFCRYWGFMSMLDCDQKCVLTVHAFRIYTFIHSIIFNQSTCFTNIVTFQPSPQNLYSLTQVHLDILFHHSTKGIFNPSCLLDLVLIIQSIYCS